MSRIAERGLNYTYLDVNILQDRKIRKLRRRAGENAPYVYLALLCTIFREGYYIQWDEDAILDVADAIGYKEEAVKSAVDTCMEVGLFSQEMYDEYHILTSVGIQKQYNLVCQKSKRISKVAEYSLLDSSEDKEIPSEGNGNHSEDMPQSKVEYSKEEDSKEDKIYNNYYCYSEEKEKLSILSTFFFKNWAAPEKETERFLAFNNTGGRCWAKMSETERQAALTLWRQEPEQPKRLSDTFLNCWHTMYDAMVSVGAPLDILMLALSDGIRYTESNSKGTVFCPRPVYVFINNTQQLLEQKVKMRGVMMRQRELTELAYKSCPI